MDKKTEFLMWLRAAGIRALKTFAQAVLAVIATSAVITEVNWGVALSSGALAAVISLLTSIAGLPEVKMANEIAKKKEDKEHA